ncbi:MAG: tetratricopeptide repeat protein [Chloroflexi bacterium]|nr:MAG: tetratricopeptide repeat protein [Chloroflexota bacterium]
MSDSLQAMELMRRGQAAARVGRRDQAREYLRGAVELDPKNVEAWLDLAGVEDDLARKRACFQKVLEVDPGNDQARLGMEMLDQDPAAGDEDDLEAVLAAASRRLDEAVGPPPIDEVTPDDEVLYCANHPNIETMLRCNRCGKPICTRCAKLTPVGYRCRECLGQQQAVFYTGGALDYVLGGGIALVLGGIASALMSTIGAWFFALILGPTVGIGIAEAVRLAVRRRRSRYLATVVAASMVLGAMPALLISLRSIWGLVTLGLFLVLAVGAAAARLR